MIRSQPIQLIGFDEKPITSGSVVLDEEDDTPEVVMFNGEPFIVVGASATTPMSFGPLQYRKVRPYRFIGAVFS